MDLQRMGWKVRQVAGRRIWYKGQAGAELVAANMDHAEQLELTMRRSRAPSLFMYGPDIAEILGAQPPEPSRDPPKGRGKRLAAARALDHLNSATFPSVAERDLFQELVAPAREILFSMMKVGK
jgi:hypothetical protein